ncbi:MAG: ABC transporter ATP-binding protein [Eubacteriales bacterium]|nr:ABC transporter ATP-binding protein [Eubacteriales bacterium]
MKTKKTRIGLFFCLACLGISRWAEVEMPLNISRLLDAAVQNTGLSRNFLLLLFNILLIIGTESVFQLIKTKWTNQLTSDYRDGIARSILNTEKLSALDAKKGEYISIINNDVPMVINDFYENLLNVFQAVMTIVFSVYALASLNWKILLIICFQILLLAINPVIFQKPMQASKVKLSNARIAYNEKLTGFLEGMHLIKTYLFENVMLNKVKAANEEINAKQYRAAKLQMYANLFSMTAGYFCNFLIIALGVYYIVRKGLTIGAMLAILQITDLLANPVTTITYYINSILAVKPLKEKLDAFAKRADEASERKEEVPLTSIKKLCFQHVSLSIGNRKILEDINLELLSGKKYLVIGENGSGKSSLLKVAGQVLDYDEGTITADGVDFRNCEKRSWYKKLSFVFQDSYVFAGSLRDNLTLFQEYSEERIQAMIEIFGLEELDGKGISAGQLSGGEKQRIALARACIREPEFLFLDEATSALDLNSQYQMEEWLLGQPWGMIHVSHHYFEELVKRYDEILFMEDGRIVKRGSYEEFCKKGKFFQRQT